LLPEKRRLEKAGRKYSTAGYSGCNNKRDARVMPRNLKPSHASIALSLLIFSVTSSYSYGQGLIPAASPQKSPSTNQAATGQSAPQTTQERRAQAYAKIMEGERFLLSLRGNTTDAATRAAAQSAFQEAARLEPTIAETHTALAEIALFQPQDLELALREATAAT